MIADADPTIVGAAIATGGLVVVAIVNVLGSRAAQRVEKAVDTGNGKTVGEMVYKLAGAVEVVIAQNHTTAREQVALTEKLDTHITDERSRAEDVKRELAKQQALVRLALDRQQSEVLAALDKKKPSS